METLTFVSSAQFLAWMRLVVQGKSQRYDRVPVARQTWIYGDGHVTHTEWGKRGATVLTNFKIMQSTTTGKLEHASDKRLMDDIDARGGLVLAIEWGQRSGSEPE